MVAHSRHGADAVGALATGRNSLTKLAHVYMGRRINPGDLVIDATVGNGHDTRFLAEIVGPAGQVIGFDVQASALAQTRRHLESNGLGRNVVLYQQGHETLLERLAGQDIGQVAAVMFNLGYRPHGDKALTTRPATTRSAISAAWHALRPSGLISLMVYVGHPEGPEELAAVDASMQALANQGGRIVRQTGHALASPVLFIARRPGTREAKTL